MSSEIKGIVFDMDGVLVDAKEWHFEALNKALGLFGYTINRYEHLKTYDGLPTRDKLNLLTQEHGFPKGLHSLVIDLKQNYTLDQINLHCRPLFHHEYALSRLKALGYRLAMASNSVRSTVDLVLRKSRLGPYFDATLSNEDVKQAKPHPEMYQVACQKLGLKPEQCLAVEDNDHGIQSAVAAGCKTMRVESVSDVVLENIQRHLAKV